MEESHSPVDCAALETRYTRHKVSRVRIPSPPPLKLYFMELLLIIALVVALLSLAFIKKREHDKNSRFDRDKKHYNPNEDYLNKVKEATKKRFEEEQAQQDYKNKIKKNYL